MAKKACVCNSGVDCADCTKCDKCGWNTARCKFNGEVICSDPAKCKACGWNPSNIEFRALKAIRQLTKEIPAQCPVAA